MINEEHIEGFHIIKCKKCGQNRCYFKEEDDIPYCPACGTNDVRIIKTIHKQDDVFINKSSVCTHFDY